MLYVIALVALLSEARKWETQGCAGPPSPNQLRRRQFICFSTMLMYNGTMGRLTIMLMFPIVIVLVSTTASVLHGGGTAQEAGS